MNEPLEIRLNEKQIEVFESFIKATDEIKRIVKEFDGKILNIKLKRALQESSVFDDLDLYIFTSDDNLRGKKEIVIRTHNDYIKFDPSNEHSSVKYIEVSCCYFGIFVNEKRIDADKTITSINKQIDYLKEHIEIMKEANVLYNDMRKDYAKLESMVKDYRHKYDYSIRADYDKF